MRTLFYKQRENNNYFMHINEIFQILILSCSLPIKIFNILRYLSFSFEELVLFSLLYVPENEGAYDDISQQTFYRLAARGPERFSGFCEGLLRRLCQWR